MIASQGKMMLNLTKRFASWLRAALWRRMTPEQREVFLACALQRLRERKRLN
jgi:hypothetical protein